MLLKNKKESACHDACVHVVRQCSVTDYKIENACMPFWSCTDYLVRIA